MRWKVGGFYGNLLYAFDTWYMFQIFFNHLNDTIKKQIAFFFLLTSSNILVILSVPSPSVRFIYY
jgi:hypothetical protein